MPRRHRRIWICTAVLAFAASCADGMPGPPYVPNPDRSPSRDNLLAAISPAIAATGDTVTLEGTFERASDPSAPTVIVQFPGARQPIQRTATVLGEHRAQVAVPVGAIDGPLAVIIEGVQMPSLAFHHAPYALGIGMFGNVAQPAVVAPSLGPVTPRSGHTSAVIGSYLYVIGGLSNEAAVGSVERAMINADGTLGTFSVVDGVRLVTPRYAHTIAVLGSYLYAVGGSDATNPLSSIERALIDSDGGLGAFATVADAALAVARQGHTSEVIGNQIYAIGGQGLAGYLDTIERAQIHPDGTIDTFSAVPDVVLTSRRSAATSAVVGTSLYVVGGFDGSAQLGTVERAAIRDDGTIDAFAAVPGAVLATPRSGHTSVVLGANLFVIGGTGPTGAVDSVEQAGFDAGGGMTAFAAAEATALAPASSGHTSAVIGNYLYVIGGLGDTGTRELLQRASINSDGSLAGFANHPLPLIHPRSGTTAAVIGHSLYLIGGNGDSGVAWALIGPDGTLSAFLPAANTVTFRVNHGSAVIGNYLYLFGGNGIGTVERAAVHPDASLGKFATVPGVAQLVARASFGTAVVGKYLYVIGGLAGTSSLSSVERAPIGAGGELGKFEAVAPALTTARHGFVCVVIGDYLYVIGGGSTTMPVTVTPVTTVERAHIAPDGGLTEFTVVPDVAVAPTRIFAGAAVIGDYLYLLGGQSSTLPSSSVERAKISATGLLSSFTPYADAALTTARASGATAVVDHSVYLISGWTSSTAISIDRAVFPAPPAQP